jgi:N-methylhydantoinase A
MNQEGIASHDVKLERRIDARYAGQSHELQVDATGWIENLHRAHEARYGYANSASVAEAVTLRVEATTEVASVPVFETASGTRSVVNARVYSDGEWLAVAVWPREEVMRRVKGPAVITEYSATTWVPAGWWVDVLGGGSLIMERDKS